MPSKSQKFNIIGNNFILIYSENDASKAVINESSMNITQEEVSALYYLLNIAFEINMV